MRIIKLFVISVAVLFLLLTAFSSLLPSHVRISRADDINRPASAVYAQIDDLRNWQKWNSYIQAMPGKQLFTDQIQSQKLSVTIIAKEPNIVKTTWRQNRKSFSGVFSLTPQQSVTTVQWYFDFYLKWYPWEKFGSIIYDNQLGPEMEQSLIHLKQLLEKAS